MSNPIDTSPESADLVEKLAYEAPTLEMLSVADGTETGGSNSADSPTFNS